LGCCENKSKGSRSGRREKHFILFRLNINNKAKVQLVRPIGNTIKLVFYARTENN